MYSLKLIPLLVALHRARHQVDSGMALTCRSRVPFRVPAIDVLASLSVSAFMLLGSFGQGVDSVMALTPMTSSLPCPIQLSWIGMIGTRKSLKDQSMSLYL